MKSDKHGKGYIICGIVAIALAWAFIGVVYLAPLDLGAVIALHCFIRLHQVAAGLSFLGTLFLWLSLRRIPQMVSVANILTLSLGVVTCGTGIWFGWLFVKGH